MGIFSREKSLMPTEIFLKEISRKMPLKTELSSMLAKRIFRNGQFLRAVSLPGM